MLNFLEQQPAGASPPPAFPVSLAVATASRARTKRLGVAVAKVNPLIPLAQHIMCLDPAAAQQHVASLNWVDMFGPAPRAGGGDNGMRPVSVELCSGHGDWIVGRALDEPHHLFVAVEVRAEPPAPVMSHTPLSSTR